MSRSKSTFTCQTCGAMSSKWEGRCNACGEWNTIVEERVVGTDEKARTPISNSTDPRPVTEGDSEPLVRYSSGISECDRVLGGGIVPGSLVLVGGDPGIGKSTLMLQMAHFLSEQRGAVLYVSGEESFDQTRLRAQRLSAVSDNLLILTETGMEAVGAQIEKASYSCVIIDSIQSIYSPQLSSVPGSVGQVRECANEFLRIAKRTGIPIFLVGHVTKEGSIAGPRVLEHLVDTVLYFEGEGRHALRILRSVKNRFGSTNEIGVFEMGDTGLREVTNPSALFLDERPDGMSGSVVIPSIEGTRPLLVEVQALVTESHLGSPRRTVSGVQPNRVSLILAVLEKRAGIMFSNMDVFVNVAGGVRIDEPASDLAVALALVSSLRDVPLEPEIAAFGEIGLSGEVRAVDRTQQRLSEASKFGFKRCLIPEGSDSGDYDSLLPVGKIEEAIEVALPL